MKVREPLDDLRDPAMNFRLQSIQLEPRFLFPPFHVITYVSIGHPWYNHTHTVVESGAVDANKGQHELML